MAVVLPTYEAQVSPQPQQAPSIRVDTSIGDALQSVGSATTGLANRRDAYNRQRDQQNAQLGLLNLNAELDADKQKIIENAPADGHGITDEFNDKYLTPKTDKFLASITDPELRKEFDLRVKAFRTSSITDMSGEQYKLGNAHSTDAVQAIADNGAKQVALDPTSIDAVKADIFKAIDNAPLLRADQREDYKRKVAQNLPSILAETLKTTDPETFYFATGNGTLYERSDYLAKHMTPILSGAIASLPAKEQDRLAKELGDKTVAGLSDIGRQSYFSDKSVSAKYGQAFLRSRIEQYHGDAKAAVVSIIGKPGEVDKYLKDGEDALGEKTKAGLDAVTKALGTKALASGKASGGGGGAAISGGVKGKASDARAFFEAQGWSPHQAAAIVGNLIQESSLRTDAANPKDPGTSVGIGQWNGSRKQALFAFARSKGKDWRDLNTQLSFVQHELQTSEAGAGNALKNASNVESATAAMIGYERPEGWTPGNPRGGNGWKARLGYAQGVLGGGVGSVPVAGDAPWSGAPADSGGGGQGQPFVNPAFSDLTPASFVQFRAQAVAEMNKGSAAGNSKIDTLKFTTTDAASNDIASVMQSGKGSIAPDQVDDFERDLLIAHGADAVLKWRQDRANAAAVYGLTSGLGTMNDAQMDALLAQIKPKGGDNAADQQFVYDNVKSRIEAARTARKDDPASYVMQNAPGVQQAWQNFAPANPATARDAIAATIAAQQRMGFTPSQIAPLPKAAAEQVSRMVLDDKVPADMRLNAVAGLVAATDDPDQQRAIFQQLVKAGVPEAMETAVDAYARGDTGAARRLFAAATITEATMPKGQVKPDPGFADAVSAALFGDGTDGEAFYGLDTGQPSAQQQARRDFELAKNAASLAMAGGTSQSAAIAQATKDILGDVQRLDAQFDNGGGVKGVAPKSVDPEQLKAGMQAAFPKAIDAVQALKKATLAAMPKDMPEVVKRLKLADYDNLITNLAADGLFRPYGSGWALFDPHTGAFVGDANGKALTWQTDELLAMGSKTDAPPAQAKSKRTPADLPDTSMPGLGAEIAP